MTQTRKLKKSETLEIRIPYPTKEAFMARCRDDGRSASEALRGFIEQHLQPPAVRPRRAWPLLAGALIAAAVGAAAAPSLARANVGTGFERLDADHDGRISAAEITRLDANSDGAISRAEFAR